MNKLRFMLAALAVALAACAPPATSGSESVEPLPDAKSDSPSSAAMKYSGGSVLADGVNVYVVWYGSWGAVARPALAKFIADLSGSHYWNILRTYHGAGGKSIRPIVRYAGEVSDAYSAGKSVADYHQVIVDHINAADLPEDPNGVYLFLPYVDVALPGLFCSKSCGSHNHLTLDDGTDIKVAYVGHPGRCLSTCDGGKGYQGITGNYAVDWMPSSISHELAEAATDPDLDGWADGSGREIGDKCWHQYGATYKTASGGDANLSLGGRDFLLQELWVNQGAGRCAMSH